MAAGVFNIRHQRHLELEIALEGECLRRGLVVDRPLWMESDSFEISDGKAWLDRLGQASPRPDAVVIGSGATQEMIAAWLRESGLTSGRELDLVQFRNASNSVRPHSPWPA